MKTVLMTFLSVAFFVLAGVSARAADGTANSTTAPKAGSPFKGAPPTGGGLDIGGPCKADAAKLCPGMEAGMGLFKCMKEKESQVSAECKAKKAEIQTKFKAAHEACAADVQKFCKDVKEGAGRIIQCMKAHESELSAECKAVAKHH